MPLEIERKFLVEWIGGTPPEPDWLIEQLYLTGRPGRRIRKITAVGYTEYWYAEKKSLSLGVFEELEYRISKEDFDQFRMSVTSGLEKKRSFISFDGRTWEWDTFSSPRLPEGYGILEVELPDINEPVQFPSHLFRQIKELTGDPSWSNQAMSKTGWSPEIQ